MKYLIVFGLFPLIAYSNPWFEKRVADSCSKYVNLSKSDWLNMRPVPTPDQGPVGLCYAYATTAFMDLYRDIHGLKFGRMKQMPSNPIWAAFLYYAQYRGTHKSFDGGLGEESVEMVRKYGMCRADVIENAMSRYAKTNNITTRDWYVITEWFLEFYNSKIEKELNSATDKPAKLREIFSRYPSRKKVADIYQNGDFNKIYESMKPFLKSKDYMAFMESVFGDCFKPTGIYVTSKNLPPVISQAGKRNNLERFVLAELDKKNPVLISYKASILGEPSNFLFRTMHFFQRANHQSVIVGKRMRQGKCEFLLKNTWGNYCKYNSAWDCYKLNGQEVGVWIKANDLMKATEDIHYFDLSKKMKRLR